MVGSNTIEARSFLDRELTERSVAFIKANAGEKNPFFLFVPFTNPHHPVIPHPDFKGKSKGGAYTDALMEIDYNTWKILDEIDELGIRENTIVVFFSDNGPTRYSPEPDHNGDPGIWSGELGSGWEGGLRTVGMMRWPGKIKANWESKEMYDIFGLSGGVAPFEAMARDVLAPYVANVRKYPHKDYSKVTRSK